METSYKQSPLSYSHIPGALAAVVLDSFNLSSSQGATLASSMDGVIQTCQLHLNMNPPFYTLLTLAAHYSEQEVRYSF